MTIRFFKHYFRVPFLLMGASEALIFLVCAVALMSSLTIVSGADVAAMGASINWLPVTFFTVVMLLCLLSMGLYQARFRESISSLLFRILVACVLGAAMLTAVVEVVPWIDIPKQKVFAAAVVSFLSISVVRIIFFWTVDSTLLKRRVVVYGAGKNANLIQQRLRRKSDRRGFHIIGFMPTEHDAATSDKVTPELVLKPETDLCAFARDHNIDEIIEAVDNRERDLQMHQFMDCRAQGIRITSLLNFFERESGTVITSLIDPSWIVFTEGFDQGLLRRSVKRLLDLMSATLLLLLTLPLMIGAAIAIIIESGWGQPVFYTQTRVGRQGKLFKIIKFRSMRTDAEVAGAQWATKNDNRVTKVGHYLRKYRIDELPQVFNVFRGDMSFVGPRPERPEFDKDLKKTIPHYDQRYRVKPGITGWAQLCYPYGASHKDSVEKVQFDLYYVKNQSLFLDLLILFQTLEVVLFGKGR